MPSNGDSPYPGSPSSRRRSPLDSKRAAQGESTRRSSHRAKYLPDFTGELIDFRRYLLLTCLGTGGYGKVYKALDTTTSTSPRSTYVAVKCLSKPADGSRQYRAQRRELKFHSRVSDHENIVTFLDAFCDHSYVYIILDLSPGGDLFKAIVEKKLYHGKNNLVKSVFTQLLSAVEHCHAKGIYHRDLKPENILCNHDGTRIWLTDFGLATDKAVTNDHGVGSSFYMSYENVNFDDGEYETAKNDVWSCGVILINMITGRNPWTKALDSDDCFSYFLKNDDFLLEVLPISSHTNDIVKQVLNPDPRRRMTLPDLIVSVFRVESFFLGQKDLEHASESVRLAAQEAARPPTRVPTVFPLYTNRSEENYGDVIAEPLRSSESSTIIHHPVLSVSSQVDGAPHPFTDSAEFSLTCLHLPPAICASCSILDDDNDDEAQEAVTPEDALHPIQPPGVVCDEDIPGLEGGGLDGTCEPDAAGASRKSWMIGRMPNFRKTMEKIRRFSGGGVGTEGALASSTHEIGAVL